MPSTTRARLAAAATATAVAATAVAATALPAAAQVEADPGAAERGAAWNRVLVWDAPGLRAINLGLANPALDPVMVGLSHRALLLGAPLAAVPYTWSTRGGGAALELAGTAAAAEIVAGGIGAGLKILLNRPRAYLVDPELRLPDTREDTAALPSNHAAVSFAWATVLANDEPVLAVPAYGLAAAISFSRMYVGVHYPSDILAGALLGYGAGLAVVAGRNALRQQGILPKP